MILTALALDLQSFGYKSIDKPICGLADDLTLKTASPEHMAAILRKAEAYVEWSMCLKFKSKKSAILALTDDGQPVDHKFTLNSAIIPSFTKKPFRFLGKYIYPTLGASQGKKDVIVKVENLLKKVDDIRIDGKKKSWIYQFGVLPVVRWDFMMLELDETTTSKLEATVTRFLKKWLKLAKCADSSILYRGTCGLKIDNIRCIIAASRTNTEIILCTSKDPTVRSVAKRRRDVERDATGYSTPKKIKIAVQDIEFKKKFYRNIRNGHDRRGLRTEKRLLLNKKTIVNEVKKLTHEEKSAKIHQLAVQSKWLDWDNFIDADFSWKEIVYAMSPSLMSFWLNSVQNTLPDPVNIRRWGKSKEAKCALCGWSNCTQHHILCWCKVALDQGRITWRHDSVLNAIIKWIKVGKKKATETFKDCDKSNSNRIEFIKAGTKIKKKKPGPTFWHDGTGWVILTDSKANPYQVPPQIAATSLRPDICIYSMSRRKVLFIELTSPFEENMTKWKAKKEEKYTGLVLDARSNGWDAHCRAVEVGARGFVGTGVTALFRHLGLSNKESNTARIELSRVAIRASHYIWISRENREWGHPSRIC